MDLVNRKYSGWDKPDMQGIAVSRCSLPSKGGGWRRARPCHPLQIESCLKANQVSGGVGISGDLVVQRKDRSVDSHTSAPDWPRHCALRATGAATPGGRRVAGGTDMRRRMRSLALLLHHHHTPSGAGGAGGGWGLGLELIDEH
jgi:hypothetical protein